MAAARVPDLSGEDTDSMPRIIEVIAALGGVVWYYITPDIDDRYNETHFFPRHYGDGNGYGDGRGDNWCDVPF